MAKEQEGVTDDQTASGQAVKGQLDTDQAVSQLDTGDVSAGGQQDVKQDVKQDENRIPLSRLNEEIKKKEAAEKETQLLRDQILVAQANQPPAQVQTRPKDIYEQLGLEPYDSPNVEQQRQIDTYRQQQQQQNIAQATNQQFIGSHPDYAEVVGAMNQYTGQFQLSAEILKILTEKPHLTASAYSSSQAAYEIVMQERQIAELNKKAGALTEQQTQQDIDNKTLPMSSAAAGGGGTVASGDVLPANPTIAQVREMEQKVADGQFDERK